MSDGAAIPYLAQTYDPYGTVYASVGTESSSYGYTGEQVDGNGLVYLRARYYQPGMGRFFQLDPSRQEVNPYRYSMDDPINHVDPSGLWRFRAATATDGGNLGIIMHDIIENLYMDWYGMEFAMAEYGIPGTGTGLHRSRVDILNVRSGEIFEIKPVSHMMDRQAQLQAMEYHVDIKTADAAGWLTSDGQSGPLQRPDGAENLDVTFNWNRSSTRNWSGNWHGVFVTDWQLGRAFPSRIPVARTSRYIAFAGRGRPGEIYYWFEEYDPEYHGNPTLLTQIRDMQGFEYSWRKSVGFNPMRKLWDEGVDVFTPPIYPYYPVEPVPPSPIEQPMSSDLMCTPDFFGEDPQTFLWYLEEYYGAGIEDHSPVPFP